MHQVAVVRRPLRIRIRPLLLVKETFSGLDYMIGMHFSLLVKNPLGDMSSGLIVYLKMVIIYLKMFILYNLKYSLYIKKIQWILQNLQCRIFANVSIIKMSIGHPHEVRCDNTI